MRTTSRLAAALGPAIAVLVVLAGCTGAPTDGPPDTSSNAPTGDVAFQAARDAYDLKLAQCLRDAGFDVKDPAPGQGITETDPGLPEAASVCMKEIGEPPRADAQIDETEFLNTMLEWADCLRDRGLEVVEPELGQAFVMPSDASDEDVAACIPPV